MRTFLLLATAAFCGAMATNEVNAQALSMQDDINGKIIRNEIQASSTDSKNIKYCTDELTDGISIDSNNKIKVLIEVSENVAKQLEGNKVTKICYGLHSGLDFTGISDIQVLITEDLKRNKVRQATTGVTPGWHEVTLNEPYTITGKKFYIGYQGNMRMNVSAVGCTMNGNNDICKVFIGDSDEAEKWPTSFSAQTLAIYGVTEGDKEITLPDMKIEKVNITPCANNGEYVTVQAQVKNWGTLPFSGANLTCGFIDENRVETQTLNAEMPVGAEAQTVEFNLPVSASYASLREVILGGSTTLTSDDLNPDDNIVYFNTLTYNKDEQYNVLDYAEKKMLVEEFTTQKCVNCPAGHSMMEVALTDVTDVVRIAHHTGYFTDKFTVEESTELNEFFFNGTSSFAPGYVADRTKINTYQEYPGMVIVPNNPVDILGNIESVKTPAFASVNIRKNYNPETRELRVFVSGDFIVRDVTPRLTVVLTEDGIVSDGQSGTTGDFTYDHTIRAFLTPATGAELEVKDNHYQWAATYVIPEKITSAYDASYDMTYEVPTNPENMNIVAFISNHDEVNREKSRVFNVNSYAVNGENLAITESRAENVEIYGLQGEIAVIGEDVANVQIFTTDGRLAGSMANAGSMALPKGLYIVKVYADNGIQTQKVSVR